MSLHDDQQIHLFLNSKINIPFATRLCQGHKAGISEGKRILRDSLVNPDTDLLAAVGLMAMDGEQIVGILPKALHGYHALQTTFIGRSVTAGEIGRDAVDINFYIFVVEPFLLVMFPLGRSRRNGFPQPFPCAALLSTLQRVVAERDCAAERFRHS